MAQSPKRKGAALVAGTDDGPSLSQRGRVRKPKVFYDPSEASAKRRSMPNMETPKPKKVAKTTIELHPEPAPIETKKPEKVVEKVSPKSKRDVPAAAAINNRRRTICVPAMCDDDANGCIVCGRSDTKKGRFVNCIDCIKRGHFTCLRNDKLYKTADRENNWQCPSCKICEYCHTIKVNEELFKCTICLNSYHLQCSNKISPLPKGVTKKKFVCGECTNRKPLAKQIESSKPLLTNRKSDGFPGFTHDETSKLVQKSNPNVNSKLKKTSLSKSSFELNIKHERPSPTPEPTGRKTPGLKNANETKMYIPISVRKDLVQRNDVRIDEVKPVKDGDELEIEYDTKTAITPHDSIPDVKKWDCEEVFMYFTVKTPEYAQLFKDNQIDGDALLLIKREDVLNRFSLKLGPALRLYSHIVSLQYKNNNPILAWNEF